MLNWSKDFETGSALVDSQHRMLIERINELGTMLRAGSFTRKECDSLLGFLGAYVGDHFKFEEDCMLRAKCPAHEKNKSAHEAFLNLLNTFKERYVVEGPNAKLLSQLHKAARDWIQHHILSVDLQLRACLDPSTHSPSPNPKH